MNKHKEWLLTGKVCAIMGIFFLLWYLDLAKGPFSPASAVFIPLLLVILSLPFFFVGVAIGHIIIIFRRRNFKTWLFFWTSVGFLLGVADTVISLQSINLVEGLTGYRGVLLQTLIYLLGLVYGFSSEATGYGLPFFAILIIPFLYATLASLVFFIVRTISTSFFRKR